MKGNLQVIFKKSNGQESIIVIKKKVNKEIGLKVIQFQ